MEQGTDVTRDDTIVVTPPVRMQPLGALARQPRPLPRVPGGVGDGETSPSVVDGGAVSPNELSPIATRPIDRCLLRLEGDYWTIVYDERVVRVRDAVGLRHLAQLLWHPQREFHSLDLMRALALSGGSRGGRPPGIATADVDAYAAAAYRRRIQELEEELAEARARDDLGRTASIHRELDTLLRELRDGVRGRHMRADAERARIAVTKAIRSTLIRMKPTHPELAAHLAATVKRGYVCVYRPDPRCPIRWDW